MKEIEDPIKAMRDLLKEGEMLNGMMAAQMSNDPNYLKEIARITLLKIKGE